MAEGGGSGSNSSSIAEEVIDLNTKFAYSP